MWVWVHRMDTDRYGKNYPLILKTSVESADCKIFDVVCWIFLKFFYPCWSLLFLFQSNWMWRRKNAGWANMKIVHWKKNTHTKTSKHITKHANEIKLIKSTYNIIYHTVDGICRAFFLHSLYFVPFFVAVFCKGFTRHVEHTYLERR